MKFEVILTGWYEVADSQLMETYNTTDPIKCAKLDEDLHPTEMIEYLEDLSMQVTPVLPRVSKP